MCLGGTWWMAVACTLLLVVGGSAVVAEECVYDVGCSQCPAGHYTRASNGSLLCCPSCAAAVLYHGDFPSTWCTCYADSGTQRRLAPRMIRFPGPARLLVDATQDPGGSHSPSYKDAFYIINDAAGKLGHAVGSGGYHGVSPAVQHALTLLADTLEDLHARVTRLEAIVSHTQNLHHPGNVNRVGTVPPPTPPSEGSCPTNYSKISDTCYYVSVWHDYRAIWKDARAACEGLNGKLAEPLTRGEFLDLTQQMSSISSASGFSFWLGGLYPGVSWLWIYAGEKVTLTPSYWVAEDSTGNRVTPGDTSSGRCLSLAYDVNLSKYFYAADECGFSKYFICQLKDSSQQRVLEP